MEASAGGLTITSELLECLGLSKTVKETAFSARFSAKSQAKA